MCTINSVHARASHKCDNARKFAACRVVAFGLLCGVIMNANAAESRFQIIATRDGRKTSEGRACFYPGVKTSDLVDRYLTSDDVRCFPISKTIMVPAGFWNYYVEQSGQRVSAHPFGIMVANTGTSLRPQEVELLPAGTIDFSQAQSELRRGEYFAVYLSNEGRAQSRPAIRPLPPGESLMTVPASMRVVPLIINEGRIAWAGRAMTQQRDQRVVIPSPRREDTSVVAILSIKDDVTPEELREVEGVSPPFVRLRGARNVLEPALPLRLAPVFDGSLLLFENVLPGEYTLEIVSPHWTTDHLHIIVTANHLSQPQRALITKPAASLTIDWSINNTAPHAYSCDAIPLGRSPVTITLSRCKFGFAASTPRECITQQQQDVDDAERGRVALRELPIGDYYVTLARADNATHTQIHLAPSRTATVKLELNAAFIIGRLTARGEGMRALLRFATGIGSSDADGTYWASVSAPPRDAPILITDCITNRRFVYVPTRALSENDTYDIELSQIPLRVHVADRDTLQSVRGARVRQRVISQMVDFSSNMVGITDADGDVEIDDLSPRATVQICVQHPQYAARCEDVTFSTDAVTVVQLQKNKTQLVTIAGDDVGGGRVYVTLGANILMAASIDQNTARIPVDLPPNATWYIAAHNVPLIRVPAVDLTHGDTTLILPPADPRTITITLPQSSLHRGGPLTLTFDGMPLPPEILSYYQALHGKSAPQIRRGETIVVGPIDLSHSTTILLGRWMADLPAALRVTDQFTNSALQSFRYQVAVSGDVVFLTPEK